MNLILSHSTEKKFGFISLRLLSSSVSSHLMKKNLVLSHLMKIKSDPVSSHQKKISSRPGPDPGQDQTRTGNPGPCGQPRLEIFFLSFTFYLENVYLQTDFQTVILMTVLQFLI